MERCGGGDSIEGEAGRYTVGCAGWSSFRPAKVFGTNWKERFSSVLNAYASVFRFVEVNSTFYRLPKRETAERWRKEAGKDFLFSLKAPKSITHEKKFEGVEKDLEAFLEVAEGVDAFFLLFQTPKSLKYSEELEERIAGLLSTLPSRFAVGLELRGWTNEEVEKLLKKVDFVHVVDPFERRSVRGGYYRLHGSPPGSRMYWYRYTDEDLRKLLELVEGEQVYVVFNNVWMCEDAIRFLEILRSL